MTTYKGVLRNRQTGDLVIIASESKTKQAYIDNARADGYLVNKDYVKTEEEFDRIMNETNCYPWDWNPNLGWK